MASIDWKAALTASQRFETIQSIQDSLATTSMSEAIAIEQAAYQISATQEEYNLACQPTPTLPPQDDLSQIGEDQDSQDDQDSGLRIGSYNNCRPVSDGVTSEVYRSGDKALKVIVAYQNIEPHNPQREARILKTLRLPCIPLLDTFRDHEQQFVLVFPFMPFTLADLLSKGPLPLDSVCAIFRDTLQALKDIHAEGIIHRDIKPSAILLASPTGPAYLSDFGTAWHPEFSARSEPSDDKILDIGTGPYRAIDVLFGNKSYGSEVDMWGVGVMLSEAVRDPPTPIFESRAVHEDGNQLGLILSIFKTIGTPTPETWPEAKELKVSPFQLWTVFPSPPWDVILPDVDSDSRDLVASLLRYDGQRATAEQASLIHHNPHAPKLTLWIGAQSPASRLATSGLNLRVIKTCGTHDDDEDDGQASSNCGDSGYEDNDEKVTEGGDMYMRIKPVDIPSSTMGHGYTTDGKLLPTDAVDMVKKKMAAIGTTNKGGESGYDGDDEKLAKKSGDSDGSGGVKI
ncbi:hypothetical protein FZEAL_3898 [Fusarium zealandicum]|uniref:cyclin-dependent kinase n=1 Tax=Fusarium zealandicum TaxID=1053134 RepID=A0A8H4UMU5_9HYPO|nr:hypothetical protein FZEAL_3898 [Fusarium zealandicum]